ncbi:MAG: methyltransferase type 11 [Deltaproteobacteria bacterium]|nr:MAG: methyltransferase type 11 [Deltaproteobacteria bacterium]
MSTTATRRYPDSKVEVRGFEARHYDLVMDVASLGSYGRFIEGSIRAMDIQRGDRILDLGAGSGRNACIMRRHTGAEGEIQGLDIGQEMMARFRAQCGSYDNVQVAHHPIDEDYRPETPFDKVFISFVLHGLPQPSRLKVLANAHRALRPGGTFHVLDFGEMDPDRRALPIRWFFKYVECPYATDYMRRDWTALLGAAGFRVTGEKPYFWGLARLLTAEKIEAPEA